MNPTLLQITVYGSTDDGGDKPIVLEGVYRFEVKNGELVISHKGGDRTFRTWSKIKALKTALNTTQTTG